MQRGNKDHGRHKFVDAVSLGSETTQRCDCGWEKESSLLKYYAWTRVGDVVLSGGELGAIAISGSYCKTKVTGLSIT